MPNPLRAIRADSPLRVAVFFAVVAAVPACDAPPAARDCEPLRIMPLGDSITEAEGGRASYRYWLFRSFADEGRPVDFVGSQTGVYRGAPRFADFDADHEGHWGWTTAQVVRHIDAWAARAGADLVLLLLGTNDGDSNLEATQANLSTIIASLRTYRRGVTVLIAQVPPVGDPVSGARWPAVPRLNRAIAEVAESLDTADERVVLVDQWTDFDVRRDTYDGIHANESGERKLAERWRAAIDDVAPFRAGDCTPGA
jgi:hypothetical protein